MTTRDDYAFAVNKKAPERTFTCFKGDYDIVLLQGIVVLLMLYTSLLFTEWYITCLKFVRFSYLIEGFKAFFARNFVIVQF